MIMIIVVFSVVLVIGIIFVSNEFDTLSKFKGMTEWEMVEGLITHVKYNKVWYELGHDLDIRYEFVILYEFEVNGIKVQSSRIGPSNTIIVSKNKSFSSKFCVNNIQAFYNALVANPKVCVWVNPKRPSDSILINNRKSYIGSLSFGFMAIILAIGMITILTVNIDLTDSIEIVEEKTQTEKEALDKVYYQQNQ